MVEHSGSPGVGSGNGLLCGGYKIGAGGGDNRTRGDQLGIQGWDLYYIMWPLWCFGFVVAGLVQVNIS